MAEKFTQPTVGRAVFAAVLARLMGQPRFDRLRGDVAGASLCRPQGYADTGSSFAGGTGDRPCRPGYRARLRLGC